MKSIKKRSTIDDIKINTFINDEKDIFEVIWLSINNSIAKYIGKKENAFE
jgi:hypothetical protein